MYFTENLPEICVILCFSRRGSGRVGSDAQWVGSGQIRKFVGRVGSEKSDPRPTLGRPVTNNHIIRFIELV